MGTLCCQPYSVIILCYLSKYCICSNMLFARYVSILFQYICVMFNEDFWVSYLKMGAKRVCLLHLLQNIYKITPMSMVAFVCYNVSYFEISIYSMCSHPQK